MTGGEVDVDYQTDLMVETLTTTGDELTSLEAGDHFLIRATEFPDPEQIRMETEFANIGAGLFLDYGLRANGSVVGKIVDKTVVNTGFNENVNDSVELVGAELNPGTGTGEIRLLGGDPPLGKTFTAEDQLSLGGILTGQGYIPTLNTGDPTDSFDDSTWTGSEIINKHLPVDRSQGQTRIDFFKLGVDLDNVFTAVTGVPLGFDIGNDEARVDVQLIDASLDAFLGVAQRMTFDPILQVDLNFATPTPVETSPGSGLFETVTTKRIDLGENVEIIHTGGDLDIDTDYVVTGRFRNDTDVFLSPAFSIEAGIIELNGDLVGTAQDLNLLPDDLSFSLLPRETFPLGDPIPIAGLFDQTFDLGGFSEVDGDDLSLTASPPTTFTVLASAKDPTINEGQEIVVNGTLFDPEGAAGDTYNLDIDWRDGTTQTVVLDGSNPAPNVVYDAASRVFTASHPYVDQIGTQAVSFTATRASDASQTGVTTSVMVSNAAPTVQLDPVFLDNDGNATLTGTYMDPGVTDSHTVAVDWSDPVSPRPVFFVVAGIDNLSVGDRFTGFRGAPFDVFTLQELEVTAVNKTTGQVDFRITGKGYDDLDLFGLIVERAPTGPLQVTVDDKEGGLDQDSVPIPWGFTLSVPNITSTIQENGVAAFDFRFSDNDTRAVFQFETDPGVEAEFSLAATQRYTIVVNWNDDNDPRPSTFQVQAVLGFDIFVASDGTMLVSDETEVTGTASTTDDAVLSATSSNFQLLDATTGEYLFTPTFRLERRYADDGDAAAGNGTTSDVSNVVVNIFEEDGPRGGTVIRPITVENAAPTLTLEETEEVTAGGVALLNGTISDPGTLDQFELEVNWGDGSTFDNDNNPDTPEDTFELISFDASPTGSQDFTIPHTYAEDLDGGSHPVSAMLRDDDDLSDTAETAFVVDFNKPPAAFDDFVSVDADQTLLLDVLADNDSDPDTNGDVDPEGNLDPARTIIVDNSVAPGDAADLLTNNGDGTFTFDPTLAFAHLPEGETAIVTFDYRVEDTEGESSTASAEITIIGVNSPPVAVPDTNNTTENAAVTTDVIDNDTDVDAGDVLSLVPGSAAIASMTRDADDGSIVANTATIAESGNTITFDPGTDFDFLAVGETATVVIDYTVQDSNAVPFTDTGTLTITVEGTNDDPTVSVNGDSVTVNEGKTADISGQFGDVDLSDTVGITASIGSIVQDAGNSGDWSWSFATSDGPDQSQTVTITATDSQGATATETFGLFVNNVAPTIEDISLSAASIDEGDPAVTVSGGFADPALGASTETFTGSAVWSDGVSTPLSIDETAGTFSTSRSFPDDEPDVGTDDATESFTVDITITDGDGGSETATSPELTVNNVAPEITGFTSNAPITDKAAEGEPVMIDAAFTDVGILDTHTGSIDWGDGTTTSGTVTESGGSGTVAGSHAYAHGGIFEITITLTDDDTGTQTATAAAFVTGVGVNDGVLQIVGTDADDFVNVYQSGGIYAEPQIVVDSRFPRSGDDATDRQSFDASAVDRLHLLLCGGDDLAIIAGNINAPAKIDGGDDNDILFGGAGNDLISGGDGRDLLFGRGGDDALLGGDGDDHLSGLAGNLLGEGGDDFLHGRDGRDIVIGGFGADVLWGGNDEDILIGNAVDFGSDPLPALEAIRAEWTSTERDRAARRANIEGTGTGTDFDNRLNGDFFLTSGESGEPEATLLRDDAVDLVFGSSFDWFLLDDEDEEFAF